MDLRPLPAEEPAVRRFVEELWLPYHRDLEATVADHALADDVDLVAEEVPFRLEKLSEGGHRAWVAVEDGAGDLADPDAELAAFVTTDVSEASSVFDEPDRLVIGDIYVADPHRGTGLARRLVDRAVERAREQDCPELALDVDVDNDRALGFYEKLGFEPLRHRMTVDLEEL